MPKKVLLIYKKSAFSIYFMERNFQLAKGDKDHIKKEVKRFKKAHDDFKASLEAAKATLKTALESSADTNSQEGQ